jgi:hypothetical protein
VDIEDWFRNAQRTFMATLPPPQPVSRDDIDALAQTLEQDAAKISTQIEHVNQSMHGHMNVMFMDLSAQIAV